jgi:hypothetical protein
LQTFLIGPGTEEMAPETDAPWRLSERVGLAETILDLFVRKNPDRTARLVALTGQLSDHAMWGAAMDVGGWLRSLDLAKYEAAFRENGIDEQVLRHVTAEDLREIGVAPVGDRRKLLAAIAELAAPSPSTEPRPRPSSAVQPKTPLG